MDLSDNNIESFVTAKGSKRMSSLQNLLLGSFNSNSSRVIQSLKSFSSLKSLSYEFSDLTAPTIIYALRNLSTLEYLYLEGSSLNDNFLPNIGQMTSLKVFSIAFGSNNGTIPNQETQVQFSTKRNSYTYKGSIVKYMLGIDLSSNRLTGEIPIEIGNMSNIHALNLSHDHLIGRIPNTFSNLQEIESLDLSCNRLNGSIPVGLLELNSLTVFSVAYNNLSGEVLDFKAQFGTFNKSSYEGNPFLCGYPLDNKCGMSLKLSNTSKINGGEESSDMEDIECFYIGFVVSFGAILLGLATSLCFNPHWIKAWFRMIESLMFCCYYFLSDNVVTPINSIWCRNVG